MSGGLSSVGWRMFIFFPPYRNLFYANARVKDCFEFSNFLYVVDRFGGYSWVDFVADSLFVGGQLYALVNFIGPSYFRMVVWRGVRLTDFARRIVWLFTWRFIYVFFDRVVLPRSIMVRRWRVVMYANQVSITRHTSFGVFRCNVCL